MWSIVVRCSFGEKGNRRTAATTKVSSVISTATSTTTPPIIPSSTSPTAPSLSTFSVSDGVHLTVSTLFFVFAFTCIFGGFLGINLYFISFFIGPIKGAKWYLFLDELQLLCLEQLLWNTLRIALCAQAELPQLLTETSCIFVEETRELNLQAFDVWL
jgi:hypothetical protein